MRCDKCNEILPDDSAFCPFCGAVISASNVSSDPERQKIADRQRYFDSDFGVSASNPIVVSSAHMAGCYLKAFRTTDGKPFTWEYDEINDPDGVIKYNLFLDGQPYKDVFFNPNGIETDHLPEWLILDLTALGAAKKGVSLEKYKEDLEKEKSEKEAEEKRAKEKKIRKRKIIKRTIIISAIFLFVAAIALVAYLNRDFISYTIAGINYDNGNYDDAIERYKDLGDYKDSKEKVLDCYYLKACSCVDNGEYKEALSLIEFAKGHSDSENLKKECHYQLAKKHIAEKDYENAYSELNDLGSAEYKDSYSLINACLLELAKEEFKSGNKEIGNGYIILFKTDSDKKVIGLNENDYEPVVIDYINYYLGLSNENGTKRAEGLLEYVRKDSADYEALNSRVKASREAITKAEYDRANTFFEQEAYLRAIQIYDTIKDYSDVKEKRLEAVYCYVSNRVTNYKDYLEWAASNSLETYEDWETRYKYTSEWGEFINRIKGIDYARELYKEKYKDGKELYMFVLEHCDDLNS